MRKIKELYNKYEEIILYVIFGGITTVVSVLLTYILDRNGIIGSKARIISDIVAISVAYITNKIWVFKSKCKNIKELLKEILSFYGARALTTLLSIVIAYIFVDLLKYNNLVVQYSTTIIVTILNYILSKVLIFKK